MENNSAMTDHLLPVMQANDAPMDIDAIRRRLEENNGRQYWRSLDELAETPEFIDYVKHEFPAGADQMLDPVSRRSFIKVMGASIALAGLGACVRQPEEKIVPFVKAPEQYVPGKPLFYATALMTNGYATGVLVESHMGRPTKVEGNPDHPASLGATDIYAQAEILSLYDPDRSQTVINRGEISSWSEFLTVLAAELESRRAEGGRGLRILTETVTSPTLASQIQQMLQAFPGARWHQYDPVALNNTRTGVRSASRRNGNAVYRFDKADVVLCLDADFMSPWMPGSVRYSRDFASRRRVEQTGNAMNRMYVVESSLSLAGAMADHRLPMRSSDIGGFAAAIATALGVSAAGANAANNEVWVQAMVKDLKEHRGASIVIAGESQPAEVHALAHAMNQALGNIGTTVTYVDAAEANPVDQLQSLRELVSDMNAGQVKSMIIMGGNPVYNAPADLEFAKAYQKVPFRAHLSLYNDETSWISQWHLPASHTLEMWSDARAYDGTVTIIQPLIAPLYDSRSGHEMMNALMGKFGTSNHDILRDFWKSRLPGDFEQAWGRTLNQGLVTAAVTNAMLTAPMGATSSMAPDTMRVAAQTPAMAQAADSARTMARDTDTATAGVTPSIPIPPPAEGGLEINFRPDPTIYDGRYANNGWLQELPKPATRLTWDNVALISPKTAQRLGVANGNVVELKYRDHVVNAPVWIAPGHADESVTVHLGYGRERAGRVGNKVGFNAYALRTSDAPWFGSGLQVTKTGETMKLATTQDHGSLEGRNIYRAGTLTEFIKNPEFVQEMEHIKGPIPTMYPEFAYEGNAWGMAIDLNACIGCNACTIACQAENNIAVVGKEQVLMGREMHWIRVDRYFVGDLENPTIAHQPVPCMHCEQAPCEVVCPVAATVHSAEGLNDMVYNRCVGTRYCSNNCPYKVRRFNFLLYSDLTTESLKLGRNPDVTVRFRGVMEKCTYCVQRINHARIEAKKEDRPIRDGEIVTACQGVCPTEAITFGNINDKESAVAKLKGSNRNYAMLGELNTQPRTTYLAKLSNPNPELHTAAPGSTAEHGA
jgi:molybdopterin-containing oxidoreductase family iron-sulfur binding subunit